MRLLNVETLNFLECFEPRVPPYAILSHRWEEEEVSFADMGNGKYRRKKGFKKILKVCKQAVADDLRYVWIDTCNIDKSSSAELTEAINSMFRWYKNARVCYAFLSDVRIASGRPRPVEPLIQSSAWFTRGWTLQELIAPSIVKFYGSDWVFIGDRESLRPVIAKITGIDLQILSRRKDPIEFTLKTFPIAKRMSWAAKRETTRIEDRAYSLLGLFSVNMPLFYGEGERAFLRLQEEISKQDTDLSILAWEFGPDAMSDLPSRSDLWAASPNDFEHCRDIVFSEEADNPREMTVTITNLGLRIEGPLLIENYEDSWGQRLAISLGCRHQQQGITKVLALRVGPVVRRSTAPTPEAGQSTLCYIAVNTGTKYSEQRAHPVDMLSPKVSSQWPVVTLARDTNWVYFGRQDAAHQHTHIWIQLPDDPSRLPWVVTSASPEKHWDQTNLTFDLADAPQTVYTTRSPTEVWIKGSIILSNQMGSTVSISFAQKFEIIDGFKGSEKILFSIMEGAIPGEDLELNDKHDVESASVFIPGREVGVRRGQVKRTGLLIARLELYARPTAAASFWAEDRFAHEMG